MKVHVRGMDQGFMVCVDDQDAMGMNEAQSELVPLRGCFWSLLDIQEADFVFGCGWKRRKGRIRSLRCTSFEAGPREVRRRLR